MTLNARLLTYLKSHKILEKWQAGFLPDSRTSDQTYVLKTLMDKYLKHYKKPLYACFVDFRKAFDMVWHEGLFLKLVRHGIGGNFLRIIRDMYSIMKVCVKTNIGISDTVGVRQGDGIRPFLFNLYINQLPELYETGMQPSTNDETSCPSIAICR